MCGQPFRPTTESAGARLLRRIDPHRDFRSPVRTSGNHQGPYPPGAHGGQNLCGGTTMIDVELQEQAALHALGMLRDEELRTFEEQCALSPELQALVHTLREMADG